MEDTSSARSRKQLRPPSTRGHCWLVGPHSVAVYFTLSWHKCPVSTQPSHTGMLPNSAHTAREAKNAHQLLLKRVCTAPKSPTVVVHWSIVSSFQCTPKLGILISHSHLNMCSTLSMLSLQLYSTALATSASPLWMFKSKGVDKPEKQQ